MPLRRFNLGLLGGGLVVVNLLVGNMVLDIYAYRQVMPSFRFPAFFLPLVLVCLALSLGFAGMAFFGAIGKQAHTEIPFDRWQGILWLAIPISVLCISPICYQGGNILVAPYLLGTVQRWALLLLPVGIFVLLKRGHRDVAAMLLLLLGYFALIPNDRCMNPFNHWWLRVVGASPLTYILSVYLLFFVVAALYGANKYLAVIAAYGLCGISLLMSVGHRLRFLW